MWHELWKFEMWEKQSNITIGLVDADLLDDSTRHPNLALLKISGFLFDNNVPFELIEDSNDDVEKYHLVCISKVFSLTKDLVFLTKAQQNGNVEKFKTDDIDSLWLFLKVFIFIISKKSLFLHDNSFVIYEEKNRNI